MFSFATSVVLENVLVHLVKKTYVLVAIVELIFLLLNVHRSAVIQTNHYHSCTTFFTLCALFKVATFLFFFFLAKRAWKNTWKDFPLISIHSFKYKMITFDFTFEMITFDFAIPESLLLLKIANNVLISIVLKMLLFGDLVVILESSKKIQGIVWSTCGSKDVTIGNLLKIVKNWAARQFEGLRMWQWNFGKYFIKKLKNGFSQLSLYSSNASQRYDILTS